MTVTAFIFARGGSEGVPRKNTKALCGKPLIAYAIAAARAAKTVGRVLVSTEDDKIAAVARDHGAEVPFKRPLELASGTVNEWLAWQHAVREMERLGAPVETFVSVPATSPLRLPEDIDATVSALESDNDTDLVMTVTRAHRNPYFNMVTRDADGRAALAAQSGLPIHQRQQVPEMYDICTVAYAARPQYILSAKGLFDGRVRTVTVPQERALDIDTEHDFLVAECLMRHRLETDGEANE